MTPAASLTKAPKLGVIGAFDGFRGFGVMMVLIQHAYPVAESWSSIVDAFFVISGFLITTLLIEEYQRNGGISLKKFYLRRGIRLLPALLATIAFTLVGIGVVDPQYFGLAFRESLAALFYVHNIFFNPIFGAFQILGPAWSLSVEEQFYFFVATVMVVVLAKRWILPLFLVLAGFYVFVNISRMLGHMGPGQAWFHRPDACAMGMMVAIVNSWIPKDLSAKALSRLRIFGTVALGGALLSWWTSSQFLINKFGFGVPFLPLEEELADIDLEADNVMDQANNLLQEGLAALPDGNYWVRWGFTLGSISVAIVVFALARLRDDWWFAKLLQMRPLTYIGAASYALYISHYPLYLMIDGFLPGPPKVVAMGKIVIGLGVGLLIHHHIEIPSMKLKDRFSALNPPKPQPAADPQ